MDIDATIGAGFLLGAGQALAVGGPASLLMSYVFISALSHCILTAVAEVGAYLPMQGAGLSAYASRYVSPSMGFSMGALHWYGLGVAVPYQLTAMSSFVRYWMPDINSAIPLTISLASVVGMNFMPQQYFYLSTTYLMYFKVAMMAFLLTLSSILFLGGGPDGGFLGFHYWNTPGAMNEFLLGGSGGRFLGLVQSTLTSAVAFLFLPEMIISRGAGLVSPRRMVPVTAQQDNGMVTFSYMMSALAMGVVAPSDDPHLLNGNFEPSSGSGSDSSSSQSGQSPFVVGVNRAGINFLGSLLNVGNLISATSSGSTLLQISTQSLSSLAASGHAPATFGVRNRWGTPYMALGASSIFSGFAYLALAQSDPQILQYLMNFINTSGFMSWLGSGMVYSRFRSAARAQGIELPYTSRLQPYGAYFGMGSSALLCLGNGFSFFFPSNFSIPNLMAAYSGIPIFLLTYVGHRLMFRQYPWIYKSEEVDLFTGLDEVVAAEQEAKPEDTWWGQFWVIVAGIRERFRRAMAFLRQKWGHSRPSDSENSAEVGEADEFDGTGETREVP
ncbi:hypothetical protein DTO021D3_3578 [Paecilomyces variotii]|nr:hypothetical protein DTO032I3_6018 [Paecilomyces variotii]KAJ9279451.1 hypothetical protein DTO021D3_3578 [Paecilomyces variotii]KAJ9342755.1 hypothetical protein DTO027B6_4626 [Paecilomyces variotii]KAJ9383955.1 hypothetical protein DTO032I4_4828 [Paecilomyces variotii]